MKDVIAILLILISFIVLITWIVSLFIPKAKFFRKVIPWAKNRKRLSVTLLSASFVLIILGAIIAPPVEPEITNLNLEKDQETIEERYTVKGKLGYGDYSSFKINGDKPKVNDLEFSKTISLKPGDNEVEIVMTAVDPETEKDETIFEEAFNVYYDYEGKIYKEQQEKDEKAAASLKKKLATIPSYEIVRKKETDKGFTAVVYMNGDQEDYLVSNAIKEIRGKNSKSSEISLLLFEKDDKKNAESILESTDLSDLVPLIRANYEKNSDEEQLFWFPDGATKTKLALEV